MIQNINKFFIQKIMRENLLKRVLTTRNYSTISNLENQSNKTKEENWITIYRFPYMRLIASIAKLRNFQYAITCVAAPVTYLFEQYALVPEYSTILALSISVTSSITLTFCTLMFRHLVGFLYIDPNREYLKIGYLTFRGKRADTVLKIENIKKFSETQKFKYQPFQVIASFSCKTKYKIIDIGGIIRRDDFELIFGRTHS